MNVFQFFIICTGKRTNDANNATHYVKLGKKRRESSKRNYYIISPRVIIKAIIIINQHTKGMETTRHRSLVERGGRKALLETLHTHTPKKNVRKPDIHESKEKTRAHRASSNTTRLFLTK